MTAGAGFMCQNQARIGDPLERLALVTLLSPGPVGRLAKLTGFFVSHARRRLRTCRTVQPGRALQIGVFRPQVRDLSVKLRNPSLELIDPALRPSRRPRISAGTSIAALESQRSPQGLSPKPSERQLSQTRGQNRLTGGTAVFQAIEIVLV